MNYYLKCLKEYAVFSGRARRKEYWMFTLFSIIVAILAAILDNIFGTTFKMTIGERVLNLPYGYFYILYALIVLVPGFAISVRRLHDVGKSGWFMFIVLIPLVGSIWVLVLLCTDGNAGDNEYGANPKAVTVPNQNDI